MSHAISAVAASSSPSRAIVEQGVNLGGADRAVLYGAPRNGDIPPRLDSIGPDAPAVPSETSALTRVGTTRRGEIPAEDPALLVVPLLCDDTLHGFLVLRRTDGRAFESTHLHTMTVFCLQSAIALARANLAQTLQEDHRRLIAMLHNMADAVVFVGAGGSIAHRNEAARSLLGDLPTLDEALAGEAYSALRSARDQVRRGDTPKVTVEQQIGRCWFLVSLSRISGEASTAPLGEVLLFQDITEHKRIEATLIESAKMSAVGQLASGVAHEFNNLIAGIFGYAQLLKINPDPAMVERGVDVILRSSERAQELTNSLLRFSRARTGRRETLPAERIVADTLLLIDRRLRAKGIEVAGGLGTLGLVTADPAELQQVFLNLLLNAEQALGDGGGTITLSGERIGSSVEITIADNGPGISGEHLSRVFEPFFTTKGPLGGTPVPGTGLGLSTAFKILEDHGGSIRVRSQPGRGTAFTVSLPLVREERAVDRCEAPATGASEEPTGILVVEADDETRERVVRVLGELGHRATAISAPEAALPILKASPPALAILDRLPDLRNRSVYPFLRASAERLPVIFLAPRSRREEFPGLADPWAFLLRKPFRDRDLATLVSRVLARSLKRSA